MKVLLVNGGHKEQGGCYGALCGAAAILNGEGVETAFFWPVKTAHGACTGCGACRNTGVCILDRRPVEFAAEAKDYDGFVLAAPAGIFGPDESVMRFLGKAFLVGKHGKENPFAGKPAAVLAVCRPAQAKKALERLGRSLSEGGLQPLAAEAEPLAAVRELARLLAARKKKEVPV